MTKITLQLILDVWKWVKYVWLRYMQRMSHKSIQILKNHLKEKEREELSYRNAVLQLRFFWVSSFCGERKKLYKFSLNNIFATKISINCLVCWCKPHSYITICYFLWIFEMAIKLWEPLYLSIVKHTGYCACQIIGQPYRIYQKSPN